MARTAYKLYAKGEGLMVGILLAGIVGQVLVIYLIGASGLKDRIGVWTLPLACLPLMVGGYFMWRIMSRARRERIVGVSDYFRRRGLSFTPSPTPAERQQFAEPILHLWPALGLEQGSVGIDWFAIEEKNHPPLLVFEHGFTTGTGKTRQESRHTVAIWRTGHPEVTDTKLLASLGFVMIRHNFVRRQFVTSEKADRPEFAGLSSTWSFFGELDTGAYFLTPEVTRSLDGSQLGEAWAVGDGWFCLSVNGELDAENFERFFAYARVAQRAR